MAINDISNPSEIKKYKNLANSFIESNDNLY